MLAVKASHGDAQRLGRLKLTPIGTCEVPSAGLLTPPVVERPGRAYLSGMPIPVEQLTEEALSLGADARALLADRLVESLDPLADAETRGLWATEALRRRDEVRSGQVDPISEDEVAEHVRRVLKR